MPAAQTLALVLVAISAAVALEIEVVVDGETKMAQVDKAALLNLWNDVVKDAPQAEISKFGKDLETGLKSAADSNANSKALNDDLDTFWLILGGILVFFMQPGFALLEAGSVRSKNTKNILFKNVCDACVGALGFWSFGFAFAFGAGNWFIGTKTAGFFLTGEAFGLNVDTGYNGYQYAFWFFQFAFAATAATIVSGAVAERISFSAYIIGTTFITVFIYPVVVHWGWSTYGWASAFLDTTADGMPDKLLLDVGATDFAGCVIVHMVGGVSALTAMIVTGPRIGRFNQDGVPQPIVQQSPLLQIFGTFILWFGWYGFNCVSTLKLSGGASAVAGKTAVTTTLSPAMACVVSILVKYIMGMMSGKPILDCGAALNGILAGLVSITSACSTCEPWAACLIGAIGALVYNGTSALILMLKLDDVVDAFAVHGACGIWGCIAASLFATERNYALAYGHQADQWGLFYGGGGKLLAANLIFILAVLAWTAALTFGVFAGLKVTIGIRVSEEVEMAGMDVSKHGGTAFAFINDSKNVLSNGLHPMAIDTNQKQSTVEGNGTGEGNGMQQMAS